MTIAIKQCPWTARRRRHRKIDARRNRRRTRHVLNAGDSSRLSRAARETISTLWALMSRWMAIDFLWRILWPWTMISPWLMCNCYSSRNCRPMALTCCSMADGPWSSMGDDWEITMTLQWLSHKTLVRIRYTRTLIKTTIHKPFSIEKKISLWFFTLITITVLSINYYARTFFQTHFIALYSIDPILPDQMDSPLTIYTYIFADGHQSLMMAVTDHHWHTHYYCSIRRDTYTHYPFTHTQTHIIVKFL